jgi:hypothetical protein
MKLTTKAKIYQWTGIFLARAEERAYLDLPSTHAKILEWAADPTMDMDYKDAYGLAKGGWQCDHGFHRPLSLLRFNSPYWFWRPVGFVHEFIMQVRRDCGR